MTTPIERKLVAIFAADVAGYSRLMARDEIMTLGRLRHVRGIMDGLIAEHRGRIFHTAGDSIMADFGSAVDAVQCAAAVQQGLAHESEGVAEDERLVFRIGVHVGDVIVDGANLLGDAVNVAARLEALAEPGGICLSAAARHQVGNKLPLDFEDMGEQQVKNIPEAIRVYRIASSAPATKAPAPVLTLPDTPSIAVLPFQNMSGDPEQEYFVDGMVEEITTAIARLPWLFVIARNSSFSYKGRKVDVKQIARELGVRYVLEGSVRKSGNRVRITGQLIDTATSAHIWADHFDGTLDDIFDLQDRVASNVVGAIEPRLRSSEIERANRKPTESLDAYDLYLRALAEFHKITRPSYENAFRLAIKALGVDPSYAPAAGMGAWCRTYQTAQGWIKNTPELAAEALRLARQAIDAGKDDADALWMAGHTIGQFSGDLTAAMSAIDRALELNPNSAQAWGARGWICLFGDTAEEAIQAFEKATRLTPRDPLRYVFTAGLARAHVVAGRYEEAVRWIDQSIAEQPRFVVSLRIKVVLCVLAGRLNDAREWLSRLCTEAPGSTIETFIAYAARHYTPKLRALYVDALRQAGLPET